MRSRSKWLLAAAVWSAVALGLSVMATTGSSADLGAVVAVFMTFPASILFVTPYELLLWLVAPATTSGSEAAPAWLNALAWLGWALAVIASGIGNFALYTGLAVAGRAVWRRTRRRHAAGASAG